MMLSGREKKRMSTVEQDAALLRIVKDRSDAKRKRSLLENEIHNAGNALCEIGTVTRNMSIHSDRSFALQQFKKHGEPGPDTLLEMVKEYFAVCDRVNEMDVLAKEVGID
jgi:hypothetical protein